MLKHYRKKGSKEITHNLYTRKDNNYCFSEDKLDGDLAIFANKEDLNIYLEENDFEEVINEPKEEQTNAKNAQVEEAKKQLKEAIKKDEDGINYPLCSLRYCAQNLLNALDEQDKPEQERMINSIAKVKNNKFADEVRKELIMGDLKEKFEEVGKLEDAKVVSGIWKDVSELPEEKSCYGFLKWHDGEIIPAHYYAKEHFTLPNRNEVMLDDSRIKSFCTLNDIFNSIEERFRKLESK